MKFEFWPFPLIRNNSTSPLLTALFLKFVRSDHLKLVGQNTHWTLVSCEHGEMKFWSANAYYAYAHCGSVKSEDLRHVFEWASDMPSRYAVRQMAKAVERLIHEEITQPKIKEDKSEVTHG